MALTGYFRSSLTSSTDIASYYYCMWGSKYVVICIMHLTIIIKYGTLLNKILFETSILRKYLPLENTIYTDEEPSLHKNALSLQRLHSFSPCSHNAIYIWAKIKNENIHYVLLHSHHNTNWGEYSLDSEIGYLRNPRE